METRSSYVIVGSFVLVMLAALFAFVIFIAKVQLDSVNYDYDIYFAGSVTGLQEGSAVRFRGVSIGMVSDIRIAPQDSSLVKVRIEVPSDTQLTQDCVASIEMQGITGVSYIQIFGGAKDSAPIAHQPGEVPVIPSRPSQIAEVVDAAPQLLNRLITLADRATLFMTEENAQHVTSILANTDKLSLSAQEAMQNISAMTGQSDKLLTSLTNTSEEARKLMAENREPLRDFTTTGLYDAALLIAEMRELMGNLSRLTSQVQRDPSGFLLAGPRAGVEPETAASSAASGAPRRSANSSRAVEAK